MGTNCPRAVVTGGSSGIGFAVAELLRRGGSDLLLVARDKERLAGAARRLAEIPAAGRILQAAADVRDEAALARALPSALDDLGGVDLLVNSAGASHPGYFESIPTGVLDDLWATNVRGTWLVTKLVLPRLSTPGGAIANVSSLAGLVGVFGYTAYSATKFAVVGLTEALRQELAPRGLGVHLLCPGDTDTPQLAAEAATKPPETSAVAGRAPVQSAEAVARELLRGLEAGRFLIVPGAYNRFVASLARHLPWLFRLVTDFDVKKVRK